MRKNVLVTLADINYLEYAKQLFYGALIKGEWEGDFLLLANNIPEDKLLWFIERNILIYRCSSFQGVTEMSGKWPSVVLDKFNVFRPYFKQWDTVVFLDADIIVRADLSQLTKVDHFSAVQSHARLSGVFLGPMTIWVKSLDFKSMSELKKTYDLSKPAFNSGVFAFKTNIIQEDSFEQIMDLHQKYGSLSAGGEEAAFNLFIPSWIALPIVYNIYPDVLLEATHIRPAEIEGVILHFILHKPWISTHPFYKEWNDLYTQACTFPWVHEKMHSPLTAEDIRLMESNVKRYINRAWLKRFVLVIIRGIEKGIGFVGLIIKRFAPSVYDMLKR